MVKSLGKEAYNAARKQTVQKLDPMKRAFIALANETSNDGAHSSSQSDSSEAKSCRK